MPSTPQLTPELTKAAEGEDGLLVHHLPGNLAGYSWYQEESVDRNHQIVSYAIPTQYSTHRLACNSQETIYPNGSLVFQRFIL